MALTKTLTLTPTNYGGHKAVKVTVVFTESTVDTTNNKSTINFTVKLEQNSWATSFYAVQNKIRVKVTINGTTRIIPIPAYHYSYSWNGKITTPSSATYNGGTSVSFPANYTITYADSTKANGQTTPPIGGTNLGPVTVAHNDDGTKTITVGAAIEDDHSSSTTFTTGAASTTGSWTLTPIARASTIAFTSGSTLTIKGSDYSSSENGLLFTITKASSSYRHQLKANFDGVGYAIANDVGEATATIGNSVNWKPSLVTQKQLLSSMQNVISKTGTIVLETYNGSNMIGSKSLTFSVNVGTSSLVTPSITIPSGSSISLIEGDDTPVREQSWGDNIHVKTMSWPKIVDTNVDYDAGYAASVSSYSLDYYDNNDTYISSINSTSISDLNEALSTNFNKNVQYKYKLKITDSRGKTASSDYLTFTLLDYSAPYINNGYSSYRCNSGGTATDNGTYLKYVFSGGISSINGNNTMTVKVGTKVSTGATYSYQNITTSGQTFSTNQRSSNGNFSTGSKYDVIFEVTDAFGAKATKTMSIQSSFVLMDFKPNGHGIAFGKTNTQDGIEIKMKILPEADVQTTTYPGSTYLQNLFNFIYPVGSIYMSVNNVNPGTIFGGTWERITGKFLLAATDNGSSGASQAAGNSGGNATHNHTLSHTHNIPINTHYHKLDTGWAKWNHNSGYMYFTEKTSGVTAYAPGGRAAITGSTYTSGTQSDGLQLDGKTGTVVNSSGTAMSTVTTNSQSTSTTSDGSSMPPYLSVYVWKRTALAT